MRDAAILAQLAGWRTIVELTHARQWTSGAIGMLRRDGAQILLHDRFRSL